MKSCCFILLFVLSTSSLCSGFLDDEGSDVIYIKPTSSPMSVHCLSEHCFTLSQVAKSTRLESESATTLFLLPGHHSLDLVFSVTNVSKMSMVANSSFANITCQQMSYFIFYKINYLLITGLKFIGCSSNKIVSVDHFIVDNSVFLGQQDTNGTALDILQANSEITNCSFVNNKPGSYYGPIKVWEDTFHAYVGGAVIANQSNVTITGCKFEGNSAGIGGAIFATRDVSVIITNSTFTGNTATCLTNKHTRSCAGGVLYFEDGFIGADRTMSLKRTELALADSRIINNVGGIMGAYNSSVSFTSSIFLNNSESFVESGLLWAQAGSDMTITNSEFAYYFGSAAMTVVNGNYSSVNIHGSHFHHNTALVGGVLLVRDHAAVTINQSTFWNNTGQVGGVLHALENTSVTIDNSEFANNMAEYGGVLAFAYSTNVTIYTSVFDHNTANYISGVLYAINQCTIVIGDCNFWNNTASYGGAIVAAYGIEVIILNSEFAKNLAKEHGGVMTITVSSFITINSSLFRDNTAKSLGGVLDVKRHSTIIVDGSKFWNSTTDHGGVILADSGSDVIILNSEFARNTANYHGGVIFIGNYTNITINRSHFHHNTASTSNHTAGGGVLSATVQCTITVIDSEIWNNKALAGAVFLMNKAYAKICDSKFWNNSAAFGGFFSISYVNLTIDRTRFYNNTATTSGGVLNALYGNTVTITESDFDHNAANWSGGTILLAYSGHLTISKSQFTENEATLGAALCGYKSTLTLCYTDFRLNKGARGTLYTENCGVTFRGTCTMMNNTAQNGGAIYATETELSMYDQTTILHNNAMDTGGGAYIYRSEFICEYECTLRLGENSAQNKGGGIHAISSFVRVFSYANTFFI